jgi:hypothetical protein
LNHGFRTALRYAHRVVVRRAGYVQRLPPVPVPAADLGFLFGFGLGAQSVQLLFGEGFLATATGWIVGFFVALIFAVLSYLFYAFAVALIAGSLGYAIGAGAVGILSQNLDLIAWVVGIVVAIVLIVVTFQFNLQKWVIIFSTAILGAAVTTATLVLGVGDVQGGLATFFESPITVLTGINFIWAVVFMVLAIGGVVVQAQINRQWEIEEYNRWVEYTA